MRTICILDAHIIHQLVVIPCHICYSALKKGISKNYLFVVLFFISHLCPKPSYHIRYVCVHGSVCVHSCVLCQCVRVLSLPSNSADTMVSCFGYLSAVTVQASPGLQVFSPSSFLALIRRKLHYVVNTYVFACCLCVT